MKLTPDAELMKRLRPKVMPSYSVFNVAWAAFCDLGYADRVRAGQLSEADAVAVLRSWVDEGVDVGTEAPCGTYAAYRRHLRRGEQPCIACRAAKPLPPALLPPPARD